PLVAAALDKHDVPSASLTLELTESTIIADPSRAVATLNQLSDMGVALAIDDFGTAYSSLSYLHRLPVDEIKIDTSLVQHVTAEGVEDGQTWQWLATAGCDQAQGFFLRPSGTAAQITRWLRSQRTEQAALRTLIAEAAQPPSGGPPHVLG